MKKLIQKLMSKFSGRKVVEPTYAWFGNKLYELKGGRWIFTGKKTISEFK
jgi:hypothetical protein